ncbi:cytochrome P450 [Flagelloscypha sp. PMI_526]|nr:cytochrome P450 [Flagelloscypha sp. PMI_526]
MFWSGQVGHLMFNRYEPRSMKARLGVLLGIPILNSLRIHGFNLIALFMVISIHNAGLLGSVFLYRCNPRHPLSAYPGPFLASLSNFWMAYKTSGGKRHTLLMKLHERYGTHVRIGPNMLSIVDVDAVKVLLQDPKVPRSLASRALEPDNMPANVISSRSIAYPNHLKAHAEQRETWSKGFTAAALEDFSVPLVARSFQLLEKLKVLAESRSEVDLDEWFRHFVWDFMGDLVFGGGFSMMEDGEDKGEYRAIVEEALVAQAIFPYLPWMNNILPHLPGIGGSQDKLLQFAEKCMIKRSHRQLAFKDLSHGLNQNFEAKEDEPEHLRPSKAAIVNDAFIGIGAGSDTTITTLSSLFFLLLTHPDKIEKLRKEIDALDEGELNNLSRLAQLPYLNACIDETLRLFPPVVSQLNRPSVGSGKVITDRFVPGGTTVFMPSFLLSRDPRYFYPESSSFWPERWLAEERAANPEIIHNTQAFVPFSVGVTLCLGKQLAYREPRLVTANLIRNFNMKHVLKNDSVDPPGIDEVFFEKMCDWVTARMEKGLLNVSLESRV